MKKYKLLGYEKGSDEVRTMFLVASGETHARSMAEATGFEVRSIEFAPTSEQSAVGDGTPDYRFALVVGVFFVALATLILVIGVVLGCFFVLKDFFAFMMLVLNTTIGSAVIASVGCNLLLLRHIARHTWISAHGKENREVADR